MKNGTDCRFHFPKFPSNHTFIAKPLPDSLSSEEKKEKLKKFETTLKKVKEALTEFPQGYFEEHSISEFLKLINVNEKDYYEALKVSEKGKMVILKRDLADVNTNNYKGIFMKAWQANMDIQFCYDQYSIVTYITDYLSKDDSGMTEVLKAALKDCEGCNDFDRLNYLKKQYFKSRQVNVCEAAYRLIPGLNMKGSNVKTKFVATGFPENRTIYFQKITDGISDRKQDVPDVDIPEEPHDGDDDEGKHF